MPQHPRNTTDALNILAEEEGAIPGGPEGAEDVAAPGGEGGIATCQMLDCIYNENGYHLGPDIDVGPDQKCATYQKRGEEGEELGEELPEEAVASPVEGSPVEASPGGNY